MFNVFESKDAEVKVTMRIKRLRKKLREIETIKFKSSTTFEERIKLDHETQFRAELFFAECDDSAKTIEKNSPISKKKKGQKQSIEVEVEGIDDILYNEKERLQKLEKEQDTHKRNQNARRDAKQEGYRKANPRPINSKMANALYEAQKMLDVQPEDTELDIKMKYRRASLKHHPDRGGSNETMQKINAAYKLLVQFRK